MKILIEGIISIKYEKKDNIEFSSFNNFHKFVSLITKERNNITGETYNFAIANKNKNIIDINIGYGKRLLKALKIKNFDYYKKYVEIIDNRVDKNITTPFIHKYSARDHLQERSINKFLNSKKNGYLIAPCGAGKTFIALKLIELLKKKTLIIVDELMLSDQWKEDILKVCNYPENSFGEVNGITKNYQDKDIVIATKQSILNDEVTLNYLRENFGFIIIDECHTAATTVFYKILTKLKPKYRLGLTATPNRMDGLDFLLDINIGNEIDRITQKELIDAGSILESKIIPIIVMLKQKAIADDIWKNVLNGKKFNIRSWQKMIAELFEEDKIHYSVAENIYKTYKAGYHSAVILKQINWIKKYYELLLKIGVPKNEIEIIKGSTEKDYRKEVIEKAKNGEIKIILTSKLLDKGISINRLDALHLVFPSKASGNTEQRVGRIARLHSDKKQPIVFDYLFDNQLFFNQLYNQYQFSRYKAYEKTSDIKILNKFINNVYKYFWAENIKIRNKERLKLINRENNLKKHLIIV